MSDEWFVERKNGVSGPYTGTKLKALAAQGKLSPSDLIRKGADGKPVAASDVAGLFIPTHNPLKLSKTPHLPTEQPKPDEAQPTDQGWYYAREGKQHGPVASKELKRLADTGQLSPTDLVWRADMTGWKGAQSVKGLFSNRSPSSPPPLPTPQERSSSPTRAVSPDDGRTGTTPPPVQTGESLVPAERQASASPNSKTSVAASILESMKAAAHTAKQHAEIQKIKLVDLPAAFAGLGKKVCNLHLFPAELAEKYAVLATLDADAAEKRKPIEIDRHATLADKAKAKATVGKHLTEVEVLLHRRKSLLSDIGEAVISAKLVADEIKPELDVCHRHIARLNELVDLTSSHARRFSGRNSARLKSTLIACAVVVGVLYVGYSFIGPRRQLKPDQFMSNGSGVLSSLQERIAKDNQKLGLEIRRAQEPTKRDQTTQGDPTGTPGLVPFLIAIAVAVVGGLLWRAAKLRQNGRSVVASRVEGPIDAAMTQTGRSGLRPPLPTHPPTFVRSFLAKSRKVALRTITVLAGLFGLIVVASIIGVIANKGERSRTAAISPVSARTPQLEQNGSSVQPHRGTNDLQDDNSPEVLTEDFLPHEVGRSLEYIWILLPSKPPSMLTRLVNTDHEDGWSDDKRLSATIRGTEESLPIPEGTFNRTHRRVNNQSGFVELGLVPEFKRLQMHYSPEIKIGAKVGDSWTDKIAKDLGSTFTVVTFRHRTVEGRRRLTAVIRKTTTSPTVVIEVTKEYAKGVGLIFQAGKDKGKDELTHVRALTSLGLDAGPGSPRVEEYLAAIERKDDREANGAKVSQKETAPAEADNVPPIPGLPKVDYSYDFSKDDFNAIPAGAHKHVQDKVLTDAALEFLGKTDTINGYIDATGAFVAHGPFTIWRDKAKTVKLREGTNFKGQTHGMMTTYHPNGTKKNEELYVHNVHHGRQRFWYENGKPSADFWCLHGKNHGIWKEWFDNGQQELEIPYVDGKEEGEKRLWHKNGNIKVVVTFSHGQQIGLARTWSEDGTSVSRLPVGHELRVVSAPEPDYNVAAGAKGPNSALRMVRCYKSGGHLLIYCDMDLNAWPQPLHVMLYPMLIRLFDANGNHLTHFSTSEGFTLHQSVYDHRRKAAAYVVPTLLQEYGNRLDYTVNMRDLRDAELVEIGFLADEPMGDESGRPVWFPQSDK